MLPKIYRLNPERIPEIARYGRKVVNNSFIMRYLLDEKLANPIFAISISVKIDKRAVIRNKIKRKFRNALINILKNITIQKGEYLIVIKSDILKDIELSNLEKILIELL